VFLKSFNVLIERPESQLLTVHVSYAE